MFLQIDLGYASKTVTAIATQGHYSSWAFVQAYLLIFSRREGEWFYYKEGGVIKVIKSLKYLNLIFSRHTYVCMPNYPCLQETAKCF